MKAIFYFLVLVFSVSGIYSQTPNWFVNEYSSGKTLNTFYEAHSRLLPAIDSAGSVFSVAQYTDSFIIGKTVLRSFNNKASFVITKRDKTGKLLWFKNCVSMDTGNAIRLNQIFAMPDNGLLLSGETELNIDFDGKIVAVEDGQGVYLKSFLLRTTADGLIKYIKVFNCMNIKVRPGYGSDVLLATSPQSPDIMIMDKDSFMPPQNYNGMIFQLDKNGSTMNRIDNLPEFRGVMDDPWGNIYGWKDVSSAKGFSAFGKLWETSSPQKGSFPHADHILFCIGKNKMLKWHFRLDSISGSNTGWYKLGLDHYGKIYFCDLINRKTKVNGIEIEGMGSNFNRALLVRLDTSGKFEKVYYDTSRYPYEDQSISIFPTSYLGSNVEIKVWASAPFNWINKQVGNSSVYESMLYNKNADSFIGKPFNPSFVMGRNMYNPAQSWWIPLYLQYKRGSVINLNSQPYINTGGNNYMGFYFDENVNQTKEISQNYQFKIFPNPSQTKLEISNELGLKIYKSEIVNIRGQIVFSKEHNEVNNITLDISSLANGLYFLNIYSPSATFSSPITVLR